MGRLGAAACAMWSQHVHASFGRTWRITRKLAGTYSSCSEMSSPSCFIGPPHAVQVPRFRPVSQDLAWQMLREWFAWRLFRCGTRRLRNLDGSGAFVGFQLFQPQLELLDLAIQFLGAAAELHAAKLRDQQLQMLNLSLGSGICCLVRFDHIFQMPDARIALKQQGFERFDVVRIGVCRGHAGSLRGGQQVLQRRCRLCRA